MEFINYNRNSNMRTKEEIEIEQKAFSFDNEKRNTMLILEVLLDIRELLAKKEKELWKKKKL